MGAFFCGEAEGVRKETHFWVVKTSKRFKDVNIVVIITEAWGLLKLQGLKRNFRT